MENSFLLAQSSGGFFVQIIPLILIFAISWFLIIRPQQKKIKEHKNMVVSLKRGDEVITAGGIVAKVEKVYEDDKIDLLITENVTVKVVKTTIQSILNVTNTKK